MREKLIILFFSICVFIFAVWSIRPPISPTEDKNPETVTMATSTEQIVSEKPVTEKSTTTNLTSHFSPTKAIQSKPTTTTEQNISQSPTLTPYLSASGPQNSASVDFEAINAFARQATVNILCTTKNSSLSPTSGTGIIINQNGLILTNAHVAQFFLLRNLYQKDFIECVIRTGSPAYPRYHAELVYISPIWVENNKTEIKLENPIGTGEKDYAFLRITDAIDGSNLPIFPFIPVNSREIINLNEPVVLVSYPAGFLGGQSIIQNLYIASAITNIQNIFTFTKDFVDVVAVGGTVISQKGASGGAVVDKNSTLIGIISTASDGTTTSSRDLNAITLAYINRSLQGEINATLQSFLSQDLASFAKTFQETTTVNLTKILTDEITKNQ
jgi:S1-C subfamily serine protease